MTKRFWIIMSFLGYMFLMVGTSNACAPFADIYCDDLTPYVGQTVTFDGSESTDQEAGTIVAYKWTFPAQAYNISGENNVIAKCKFYPAGGPYAVTLKVTDNEGKTDTETVNIDVTSASYPTWYVKPGGDDDNDGQSWVNAFRSIQVGISSADETETVIVKEGVYHENIDFHGGNRDITVKSEDPCDPAVVANTVIDGVGLASVVTFEGSETSTCELTGFTIRDGGLKDYDPCSAGLIGHWPLDESNGTNAPDSSDNNNDGDLKNMTGNDEWKTGKFGNALDFEAGDLEDYVDLGYAESLKHPLPLTMAAWIYRENESKQAIICLDDETTWNYGLTLLVNNGKKLSAILGDGTGGGPGNRRWKIGTSDLNTETWWHVAVVARSYTDIQLYINGANDGGTNYGTGGDIVYYEYGHATIGARANGTVNFFDGKIDDVRVYDKALSEKEINQLYRGGGGIYGNDTEATISKCVIKDSSALEGGGIAAFDGEISNCVVVDNSADYSGGGLANSGVSPTITNCLFNDNSAKYGAAIYCFNYSDAIIENCTISQNVSDALAGGIMADSYSDPLIKNSIVWDNYDAYGIADIDAYNTSAVTADYTDFGVYYEDPCSSGLGTGTGFIQTDPFFANPATNDFHLKSVDGRWDPALKNWVTTDTISSPCIAAGDPCVVSNEPVPNGGRINMGFYGNTDYASKIQPYQVTINLVATDGEPLVDNPEWYIVYESGGYYYYYDSVTRHSGDQVTLAAGTYYALCLDTETNCEAPSVQDSDYVVGSGQPSSYDMEYRAIGYLSVTLTPSTAQWREEIGSGTWRNSGDVVELTAFGSSSSYGVEFKPHLGYDTPAPIGGIFIYRGQQTNRNVYYPDLTRYVSYNSGNNEYDGKTPATAFQTIKYAIHEVDVRGGGFLYFAGEHYTETLQASDFNDLNYLTKCRTTAPSVLIAALQSVFPPGNVNFSGPFYFDQ